MSINKEKREKNEYNFILLNKLHCSECGKLMKSDSNNYRTPRYRCSTYFKNRKCTAKYVTARKLENKIKAIVSEIERIQVEKTGTNKVIPEVKEFTDNRYLFLKKIQDEIKEELISEDKEIKKMHEAIKKIQEENKEKLISEYDNERIKLEKLIYKNKQDIEKKQVYREKVIEIGNKIQESIIYYKREETKEAFSSVFFEQGLYEDKQQYITNKVELILFNPEKKNGMVILKPYVAEIIGKRAIPFNLGV